MSFTTKVKEEIVNKKLAETENYSILAGFVRNNATWNDDKLELINENEKIINYFKNILDIETKAYLKGVFLNGGSINDPKTSRYHMEILIDYPEEAVFVQKVLNSYNLNIKMLNRDRSYMLYLKEAEKISDFLKIVDANNSVLYYEDVRIYRDKKNQTNRLNNCEQANTDRIIASALEQLNQIEILKKNNAIDLLDDKTKEALYYREKYKEASLKELSEKIAVETGRFISKSGLNHRFRKIKELASKFMVD